MTATLVRSLQLAEPEAPPSPLLAPALFLAAVAVGCAAGALSALSPDAAITWAAVALAAWCTALLLLTGAVTDCEGAGLASWRIGPWSLVWGALAFGLATITWTGPQYGPAAEILPSSVLRALWMTGVAFTLLAAGYCAGPFRLAGRPAQRLSAWLGARHTWEIRSGRVPWALFAFGIAAQAATAATTGRFGYVGYIGPASVSGYAQYLAIAGECVPLAVMAAAVRHYRQRAPGAGATLAVLLAGAVIAGGLGGNKQNFVVAVLAAIIPRTAARGRLPAAGIIAAVLFFLLLVVPFNAAYRASARGDVTLSTGEAVATAPGILGQVARDDLSLAGLRASAAFLAVRVRTIDAPAIIMQRVPGQIAWASPGQLAEAPLLGVVPRVLWPGKPVHAAGLQASRQYFELGPDAYTASDVTPEGDLWAHGGWPEVVAGMFLLGLLIRVLDDMTDTRQGPHGAFLVLLLFPAIVQAGDDWSGLLAGMPGMVVLWIVVVAFAFRRGAPG